MAVCGCKQFASLVGRDTANVRHNRSFDFAITEDEMRFGFRFGQRSDCSDDAAGTVDELVVRGAEIDHQVAVGLAETDHCAGGEHVEHHFRRCARFETRRTAHHFGADDGVDRHVGDDRKVRIAIATEANRSRAHLLRILQSADDVRRPAAAGDADNDVAMGKLCGLQIGHCGFRMILGSFDSACEGGRPAGDDAEDQFRRRVECGRTFRRVEHAEPSRSSRADVDEPSAVLQRVGDYVDGPGDCVRLEADGCGDAGVFIVHERDYFARRKRVDPFGSGIASFGGEVFEHCQLRSEKNVRMIAYRFDVHHTMRFAADRGETRQDYARRILMNVSISAVDLWIIAAYLVGTVAFGLWVGRKQEGAADYFLGDRDLPWWAVLFSIVATETSTVTFLSIPGTSYNPNGGNFTFLQLAFGYVIGRFLIVRLFLPEYFRGQFLTAYEVLNRRFGGALQQTASLLFIITRTLADGLRLYLGAIVLQAVSGLDMALCIVLLGATTIVYTFFGGMKSVVWTDVIQFGIYMLGAAIAVYLLITGIDGGTESIMSFAREHDKLRMFDTSFDLTKPYTLWAGLLGGMFFTLASHGTDQLMVQRYLCARNQKDAARAIAASGVVVLAQFAVFLFIGIGLACFYDRFPPDVPFKKNDQVFASFIVNQMPVGAVGLTIAAVFAAGMSTLSSSLNSSAAAVVNDFYLKYRKTPPTDGHVLAVSRALTVAFGIAQIGVGIYGQNLRQSAVDNVLAIAGFTTGIILGVFFLGTLTKRVTQGAALAGMISGLTVLIAIKFGADIAALIGVPEGSYTVQFFKRISTLAWPWYAILGSSMTFAVGVASSAVFPRGGGTTSRASAAE